MAAAANILEAAEIAARNAVLKLGAGVNLNTILNSWAAAIPVALPDPSNLEQRRVLDWIPRIREIADGISTSVGSQTLNDANAVGTVVYRSCIAAFFSSITNAQKTALTTSYNALFA